MKKLLLLIIIYIFVHAHASSQSCVPIFIVFTSQSEIDSFQITYPNCTEIEGDVLINGADISNMDGLNMLTAIGGHLEILYNDVLTSITGLMNVNSIGGNFHIGYNNALTSLTGLNSVNSIGGDMKLKYNFAFVNLNGLDKITSVHGDVWISTNYNLTNLTGLDNLSSIGGDLIISSNPNMTNLNGLANVDSIGGILEISSLYQLSSLSGLGNIDASSISDLTIRNNPVLSNCDVESICDYLLSPNGTIFIQSNKSSCNSRSEIENACEAIGIQDLNFASGLSIYPNPAKNEIIISNRNEITINEIIIYNHLGQKVLDGEKQKKHIDISKLDAGIYFLELVGEGFVVREKVIIR